jgi:hypothetical protein
VETPDSARACGAGEPLEGEGGLSGISGTAKAPAQAFARRNSVASDIENSISETTADRLTQEELDLLVAGTRRMDQQLRERLRVLAMIEPGARAGELRALTFGV